MNSMKFKLNTKGVRLLMQSPEMQNILQGYGRQVQANAGSGYGYNTQVGKRRAITRVYAATPKARRDNNEHNTLLKSLHG